jgi:hypothetical protein
LIFSGSGGTIADPLTMSITKLLGTSGTEIVFSAVTVGVPKAMSFASYWTMTETSVPASYLFFGIVIVYVPDASFIMSSVDATQFNPLASSGPPVSVLNGLILKPILTVTGSETSVTLQFIVHFNEDSTPVVKYQTLPF